MRFPIIALLLCASLVACARETSSPTPRLDRLTAPSVKEYPSAMQAAAAIEMEGNACPVLNELTIDYGVMRDQSRVLKGQIVDIGR